MELKLFDNSNELCSDDLSKIEINKEFACRYEHNKKREDLQRLDELKKKGIVDSSNTDSDDESFEEELIDSSKKDLEFFDALIKVRKHDVLKDKGANLFKSESEPELDRETRGERNEKKREQRPIFLKDVTAKHLIEEGPEFDDIEQNQKGKSYLEEQEELRKEFLDAVGTALDGDDDDGELLMEKKYRAHDGCNDESAAGFDKKLDEYFGDDEKLDKNEMFLKDYFRKKMWLDKDKGGMALVAEGLGVSEDEEEIERQEDYEREYNFRYEENVSDRVLGHSRYVEGSVRKKASARKLQRKSKEERLAQAEYERKEELKHLKNLKKKEINEKLRKIKETAGISDGGVCFLDEDDLEEDFDSEEYDRKMKKAFDDSYYVANDADPHFGSDRDEDGSGAEKPDFKLEDGLLGLPKGWDDMYKSGDGFSVARERVLKKKMSDGCDNEHSNEEKEVRVSDDGRTKKKQKISSRPEEAIKQELEEYYKLDYEDTIGDLKTRFKYRSVNPRRYGLSTEELLLMDDKELNQYVSVKKLAPYRQTEWKVPRIKRYSQKLRNKSLLEGGKSNGHKIGIDNLRFEGTVNNEKPEQEVINGDQGSASRRSRRRHRQAELKLSHSRLLAYGKLPAKAKS